MTPPYPWIVMSGSLAICYPISKATRPFLGIVTALGFTMFAFLTGATVSHLLSLARWRRVFSVAGIILVVIVAIYVVRQPLPHSLVSVSSLPPMNLVTRAATTEGWPVVIGSINILFELITLSFAAFVFSFRATLKESSQNAARKSTFAFRFPGRLSGLVAKDLRHFRRLLDIYLGLLAALAGCIYLLTSEVASLEISIIFLTMIFLPNSPLAFNSFGLDSPSGLDRYRLLPLTGNAVVLSKNLAFAFLVGIQITPVLLLAVWRLGMAAGLGALIAGLSLACAYLTWGNWMSLSHPVKMHFFRFSSSSASIFDAIAGIVFASSPGIAIIYLLHNSIWSVALVPLIFGIMYVSSLFLASRRFPRKLETIERALA
jgi:hypothetical protein